MCRDGGHRAGTGSEWKCDDWASTSLSAKHRVKAARGTGCRGHRLQAFRPNRSCTYRGTSWPGGPRSARFTARTLSAFRTTSTGGTSFTLEEAGRDGVRRRRRDGDLLRTSNSLGPAVCIHQKAKPPCASSLHVSLWGHLTKLADLVTSSPASLPPSPCDTVNTTSKGSYTPQSQAP